MSAFQRTRNISDSIVAYKEQISREVIKTSTFWRARWGVSITTSR